MKRILILFLAFSTLATQSFSQDTLKTSSGKYPSPYTTKLVTDGAIIVGGIGLTALGVKLIADKKDLTPADLVGKTRESIPFFDRGNAGYYSAKADKDSYIPFQASFAMPVLMALINKNQRDNIGQVLVLYVETMAVTGTLFTMATGNVYRSRPYVYGADPERPNPLDNDSHRSFYAGHTAATAAATFYMAKVYSDFNPGSKAKPYVWGVAAAVPALVGYLRYKSGMHFLSDNVLGYVLGAGAGILVPQLHKRKKFTNVSLVPVAGDGYKGLAMTYRFK